MTKNVHPSLSIEEMQDAIRELAKGLMHYGSRMRVLELLLLEKGLATEAELEKAERRVSAQMNREISGEAKRRKKVTEKIQ